MGEGNGFDITTFISVVGALAWLPTIFEKMKRQKIYGKVISRYINYDATQFNILYRLNIVITNRRFNLKYIECELEYKNGYKKRSIAKNFNEVIFNPDQKLSLRRDLFINNMSVFENDKSIDGYLFFTFDQVNYERVKCTKFTFYSYSKLKKVVVIDENKIDEEQLFNDKSIWEKVKEFKVY